MGDAGKDLVCFVSGHLDLTQAEFDEHYEPRIDAAIEKGARFVVGDARGCDWLTMQHFEKRGCKDRLRIFHMLTTPRNSVLFVECVGGFKSDEDRDAAMTKASDEDIAWVRPGRERSGTARNIERRAAGKGGWQDVVDVATEPHYWKHTIRLRCGCERVVYTAQRDFFEKRMLCYLCDDCGPDDVDAEFMDDAGGITSRGEHYMSTSRGSLITSRMVWAIRHAFEEPHETLQARIDYFLHKMAKVGATKHEVMWCIELFGIDDHGIDVHAQVEDWDERLKSYGYEPDGKDIKR